MESIIKKVLYCDNVEFLDISDYSFLLNNIISLDKLKYTEIKDKIFEIIFNFYTTKIDLNINNFNKRIIIIGLLCDDINRNLKMQKKELINYENIMNYIKSKTEKKNVRIYFTRF